MMKGHRARQLLLLILLLCLAGHAQDYDDSDDDDDSPGSAGLYLHFDKQGGASVDFGLPGNTASLAPIRIVLAQVLHCPADRFVTPSLDRSAIAMVNRWPAERREKYLQQLSEYNQRRLTANCDSVLAWHAFGRDGTISLSPLLPPLKDAGVQQLWVSVAYPPANHIEYSKQNLTYAPQKGSRFLGYRIAMDASNQIPPIHLTYGLTRGELYRSLLIMAAFFFLPIGVTLWMRQAALRTGKVDPTAAWFSYFWTINWGINGSMLLWITSGLGARQNLQDCLSFARLSNWESVLLDVLIVIGPAFLAYFICVAVSYPLYVHLRSTKWTRREFLTQQLVNVGSQALPLMFFLAATGTLGSNSSATAVLFVLAYVSWLVCRSLKLRLSKSYPHALTTGELRDRVFALAKRAAVNVSQIFVLPTGKGQVANAYAAGNRTVMFTDYLLQHLTKREVDGVAAHELSHLKHGHVGKRALAFYAALMLPAFLGGMLQGLLDAPLRTGRSGNGLAAHIYAGFGWFWGWSQHSFVLIMAGLAAFYFLSRHFEHAADESAVLLTGDPEAQITGLLKLSRLNLMPIQWGKGAGSWLTHPSTVRRAERIAAASGMSAEQLQVILERYRSEMQLGSDVATSEPSAGDHYAIPEATDPENIRSTAKKRRSNQVVLWTSLLAHVIPPALIAASINVAHLEGSAAIGLYVFGAAFTPLFCVMTSAWLGVTGRRALRARLAQRFQHEGLRVGDTQDIVVGFAPGAVPRFYGANYYDCDVGFLVLSGDHLCFVGEQVRFSMPSDQIEGFCVGQGGPSWWKFPRVYLRWKHADGMPSVFSLASLEPCSIGQIRKQADALYQRLQRWRVNLDRTPSRAGFEGLPSFAMGEVTNQSPRRFGGLRTNLNVLMYLFPLAAVVNTLFRLDSMWYIFAVILVARLVESVPYWRFRDRMLTFAPRPSGLVAAAEVTEAAK